MNSVLTGNETTLRAAEQALDAKASAFRAEVVEIVDAVFTSLVPLPLAQRARVLASSHRNPVFLYHGAAQRFANESLQVSREIRAYRSELVDALRLAVSRDFLPGAYFLYLFRLAETEDDRLVLLSVFHQYLRQTRMKLPDNVKVFLVEQRELSKIIEFF